MLAIAAAAAFVGLFALWVVVPRFILRRRQAAEPTATPATGLPSAGLPSGALHHEELAPAAAD